jgi:hypothetical protein
VLDELDQQEAIRFEDSRHNEDTFMAFFFSTHHADQRSSSLM